MAANPEYLLDELGQPKSMEELAQEAEGVL